MRGALALLAIIVVTVHSSKERPPVSDSDAKDYLQKFGYIEPNHVLSIRSSKFVVSDQTELRNAIKNFQRMAGLRITGELDNSTKVKMAQPRCGVSDIQAYVRADAAIKWEKNSLTYGIESYTNDFTQQTFRVAVQQAFDVWAAVTPLKFTYVATSNPDITVKFGVRNHGDPWPFDGKGNVLAHATLPYTDSRGLLHFDDDEDWAFQDYNKMQYQNYMDILTVAVHEIGHVLGLEHSDDQRAIMSAFYQEPFDGRGTYLPPNLGTDDIARIQALYGRNTGGSSGDVPSTTSRTTTRSITLRPRMPTTTWSPWPEWSQWTWTGWNRPRRPTFGTGRGNPWYPTIVRSRFGPGGPPQSAFWGNFNRRSGYY